MDVNGLPERDLMTKYRQPDTCRIAHSSSSMIVQILTYLTEKEAAPLIITAHRFSRLATSSTLWKALCAARTPARHQQLAELAEASQPYRRIDRLAWIPFGIGAAAIGPRVYKPFRITSPSGNSYGVTCLKFLSNAILATGSPDNNVRLWSALKGDLISTLVGHTDLVLCISALGEVIGTGSRDCTARLWDVNGKPKVTLEGHKDSVTDIIQISQARIATASDDQQIWIWTVTGSPLTVIAFDNEITCLLSLSESAFVSGAKDRQLYFWNTDGQQWRQESCDASVTCLLRLNNDRFVAGYDNGALRLFDVTGKCWQTHQAHHNAITCLTMVSAYCYAAGSQDYSASIWSVNGARIAVLPNHSGWVNWITVLPEGTVASGCDDATTYHWSFSGELTATLYGQQYYRISGMVGILNHSKSGYANLPKIVNSLRKRLPEAAPAEPLIRGWRYRLSRLPERRL